MIESFGFIIFKYFSNSDYIEQSIKKLVDYLCRFLFGGFDEICANYYTIPA